MEKPLRFEWTPIIAVDDLDLCSRLKPSAILAHFQDIATEHAALLNIGAKRMGELKCFWVLTKVAVEIVDNPNWCTKVKIITYPRSPSSIEATRDYYMYGDNGRLLAKGSSKWCVLDYAAKKIRRISDVFSYPLDNYYNEDAIQSGCTRLVMPTDGDKLGRLVVKTTDLDRNRHMNNAKYGDTALNFEDIEFVMTHDIKSFQLNYLSELAYGEEIDIMRAVCGDKRIYYGTKADGKPSFIMETLWKKRK